MNKKQVLTYTAQIWVGLKDKDNNNLHIIDEARSLLQHYVDEYSYCVTLTKTNFFYKDGNEEGFFVGLINYPRFPSTNIQIRQHALRIAKLLKKQLGQKRVSIVFPDETIMLGDL